MDKCSVICSVKWFHLCMCSRQSYLELTFCFAPLNFTRLEWILHRLAKMYTNWKYFYLCILSVWSSMRSQLNTSPNDLRNSGSTCSMPSVLSVSLLSDVAVFPSNPHGIIWSNQERSISQFNASPCDVINRFPWTPEITWKLKSLIQISLYLHVKNLTGMFVSNHYYYFL